MGRQIWLLVFFVTVAVTNGLAVKTTEATKAVDTEEIPTFTRDPKIPLANDPMFNKMLPSPVPVVSENPETLVTERKEEPSSSTVAAVPVAKKDESDLKDVSETADDIEDDDDWEDYDDEYDYDESSEDDYWNSQEKPSSTQRTDKFKLTPIKGDDNAKNTIENDDSYEYDDEIDDIKIPCPRDCVCEKNMNSYIVATCSRLDSEIQKFSSDITDLQVIDVGPKYPIILGEEFFLKVGLKQLVSIKISNCTIGFIAPSAFKGLTDLYSVNFTNTNLNLIHPDTFANNTKMRLLTLAGNDLSAMQEKPSPYTNYMLKSSSIEELDLSRCNLKSLLPTAFNELNNIVFINLAENRLTTLPANLFEKVETIEELDLSFNAIADLPKKIFTKTALAMLHLKYNEISTSVDFVTSDLQKLDLSYCKIRTINAHMFKGLEGLNSLILKGNGIRKINQAAFMSLKNLRHIDLSFNDLEQVPALMFATNTQLDFVKLSDNPRLKKLPLDGFESVTGSFNIYHLDVSNCDINELGINTFSTMPELTRVNLAWNNLVNIDPGVFSYLNKLKDLDLSNNLLENLDDNVFLHNRQMTKLILAGNTFEKISAKVFSPLDNLIELDISDCDLRTLWSDNTLRGKGTKILKRLRYFNVSNNEITTIRRTEVEFLSGLRVLDIDNNPLNCNADFMTLITWLTKRNVKAGDASLEQGRSAKLELLLNYPKSENHETWQKIVYKACKRTNYQPEVPEVQSTTTPKMKEVEMKPKKEKPVDSTKIKDSESLDDDDDYYDSEYEDDDIDENAEMIDNDKDVKEKDLFVKELDIIQKMQGKESDSDEEYDEEDEDDEDGSAPTVVSRLMIIWPILIVVLSALLMLMVIGKLVSMLMRKRGERYRQALLASKNSIVYQKLSEDINRGPPTPKVNRYQPINQVQV
ncbi:toll-like receptor 13 isoform X2 [Phlebotomus papatasi]|uniref:toll-like receptor 13 isoform X2 n=1 Tax=Phlebotomus papatasi TaxID=29031 RepID=UPI00248438E7|nr:toll-like receptor 13 isoform X2 [Phlebotomus papatasi]